MGHFRFRIPRGFHPLLFVLFAFALLCVPVSPAGAELIRTFDVTIRIQPDASFSVDETIGMDFEDMQRHGIYRMIPWRYERGGKTATIGLENIGVTDGTGRRVEYKTSREGSYTKVRIGSADRLVTGRNTYRIHYVVRRAMHVFNDRPELYWNVTGDKWPYPILAASARVYPPRGVKISGVKIESYRGPEGSRERATMVRKPDHVLFTTGQLSPSEGMTVVVGLPPGSVKESAEDRVADAMNTPFLGLVFPLLTLGLVGRRWWNTGRDEDAGKPAAIEWDPPKNLSPAEVGTLVDEKCDMADIVSTVVDLAVRGYLRIEEHESKKFLFFSSKDYTFVRTGNPSNDTLSPHEEEFLRGMFGSLSDSPDSVTLSDLKNKFYTHLPGIRKAIYESLTRKRMFTSNPDTTRGFYLAAGIILAGLAAASFFFWQDSMIWLRVGLVVAGVIIALFAPAMPAKTAAGSDALRQSLGFRRFVRAAEKDRIAVLAQNDPTIFGRLLPYAMVLGVADQWAEAFRDLLREPPSWYTSSSYGYGHPFSSTAFMNDLGSGMTSMGSTFASTPSSSGGSGFSGGSGGGGGGGGGGSW